MTLSAEVASRADCADKLDVIDAAFARPSGPAAHFLAERVCPFCPIWRECLEDAMKLREHGPWGGTLERQRRRRHTYRTVNPRRRSA